jgi:hypothetical protein
MLTLHYSPQCIVTIEPFYAVVSCKPVRDRETTRQHSLCIQALDLWLIRARGGLVIRHLLLARWDLRREMSFPACVKNAAARGKTPRREGERIFFCPFRSSSVPDQRARVAGADTCMVGQRRNSLRFWNGLRHHQWRFHCLRLPIKADDCLGYLWDRLSRFDRLEHLRLKDDFNDISGRLWIASDEACVVGNLRNPPLPVSRKRRPDSNPPARLPRSKGWGFCMRGSLE